MKFIVTLVGVLIVSVLSTSICYADNAKADKSNIASLIPMDKPVLEERAESQKAVANNPFAIVFYKPTYILPFYYTVSPYHSVYNGNTPDNQTVRSQEFKAQFSFMVPLWHDILGKDSVLNAAYTQQMYWQFYTKSQYFRETNYQPELFLTKKVMKNFWLSLGAEHQSNGRGGDMERSWNRAYLNAAFSGNNFAINLRPWALIFQGSSSDLHNSDIARYMGHGEMIFTYKWHDIALSLTTRNNFESGFSRGANEIDCSFPLFSKVKGYVQFFSGYGQSLIEYNHYTNAFGIGIALSDWI